MHNSKTIFRYLEGKIQLDEQQEEIHTILYILLEHFLGITKTDVIAERAIPPQADLTLLENAINRINLHEPLQYIIGQADFFGRTFNVNPSVLIPRPETEDVIRTVKEYATARAYDALKILDIGTGSGCIPITLALEIANALVYATDISKQALQVAKQNAARLNATVNFIAQDILHTDAISINDLDVITSNPPYVTVTEKHSMKQNVLNYEPHLALFVPDEDPLVFYKAITTKAIDALNPGGLLVFEINPCYGNEVASLLRSSNFTEVEIIKDIYGKERIVKGIRT
jgi:release factor glutamine methyltransferase